MDNFELKKHLGLALHLLYYHYERLNLEDTFENDYWEKLNSISDIKYLNGMHQCLSYAIKQDNYCLNEISYSPFAEIYTTSEIKLFFDKFHRFLDLHLNDELGSSLINSANFEEE